MSKQDTENNKLISMVEFVKQQYYEYSVNEEYGPGLFSIIIMTYAEFLSKSLELQYFIPCTLDNVPLVDPCKHNQYCADMCQGRCQEEFNEALDRVLFEGFEKRDIYYPESGSFEVVNNYGLGQICVYKHNAGYFVWNNDGKTDSDGKSLHPTIEYLIDRNLTLTPTALKEIFN